MNGYRADDDMQKRSLVEAAAWRVHLTEAGVESSEDFEAWLAGDARNRDAWQQLRAPWELFGEQATSPELIHARRVALDDARRASRRRWQGGLPGNGVRRALAAGVAVVALGGMLVWMSLKPETYRTDAGERRIVALSDGSQLSLDAQTEVRVAYDGRARTLRLLHGQARFDVARDVERPFSVQASGQKVVATGTAFNVDLLDSDLRVTLIEGSAVVLGAANDMEMQPVDDGYGIELGVGDQLLVSAHAAPSIAPASIERTTAWEDGRLIFEGEPLSMVARRMNRYSRRPLVIADAQTAELRISGVFKTNDVDGFVATITHYFPLHAQTRGDGTIELRHR